MAWFAVDDTFHSHRKRLAAGNAAVGEWTACGSYCGQHLTDGIVPGEVAKLYGRPADIKALIRVRLWHGTGHDCERCPQPEPGAYIMHDYLDYNPSREEVEDERRRVHEAKSRAGRAGGIASGVSRRRNGQSPADAKQTRSRREADAKQTPPPCLAPASDLLEADAKQTRSKTKPPPLPSPTGRDPRAYVALRNADAREDDHTLAGSITAAYAAGVPLSDHARAHRTIGAALDAGYTPDLVRRGVGQLIAEQRACTLDTLRIAIHADDAPAAGTAPPHRRTATEKATQWLTVGLDDDGPPVLRAIPGGLT